MAPALRSPMASRSPLASRTNFEGLQSPVSVVSCPETFIDIPTGHDVDRLLQSWPVADGCLRCRVTRERSKNLLELYVEEGNVFVLSAVRTGNDWHISEQKGGSTKAYIATVTTQKDGSTFTCGRAKAGDELLYVRHEATEGSGDMPELNMIQVGQAVDLDASPSVLANAGHAPKLGQQPHNAGVAILESRLPKWNGRTKTYELQFHGRAKLASARNFQLVHRGGQRERPVLLYGKLDDDVFALDFAHPLSILQSFAIVLTTWKW